MTAYEWPEFATAPPAQPKPPSLRERILHREDLDDLPEPSPLIVDTIDRRTIALLVGHRSTGKTFMALDWALCVATGKSWQGRECIGPDPVLYIAAEGAYGLTQRIEAWEQAWKQSASWLDVLPEPVQLLDDAAVTELAALAEVYRLVVIDTLARCTRGADENSARDMGLAVDAAYRIRGGNDTTVLLVHHTGKDRETTRGSSALEAGVDTVYLAEGDPGHLTLARTKRKDGPPDDRHNLRLTVTGPSCTIDSHAGGHGQELRESAQRLMSIFMSTFGDLGATRVELRKVAEEHGIKSSGTFTRALRDLLQRGDLTNRGSDDRPRYYPASTQQEA